MKKIILMCFILISFSAVKAQFDYVITQENCKINIKSNNQLIRQLNAKDVLVWQKGGYYIYLSDGITSWSQPMFNIDNYDTVSTLIDSVTVWQVLCGGTGSIFLDNQQISISGDTVYLERGGFAVLPESSGGGTDDQQLSKSNDTIYLEDGGFVVVPSLHQGIDSFYNSLNNEWLNNGDTIKANYLPQLACVDDTTYFGYYNSLPTNVITSYAVPFSADTVIDASGLAVGENNINETDGVFYSKVADANSNGNTNGELVISTFRFDRPSCGIIDSIQLVLEGVTHDDFLGFGLSIDGTELFYWDEEDENFVYEATSGNDTSIMFYPNHLGLTTSTFQNINLDLDAYDYFDVLVITDDEISYSIDKINLNIYVKDTTTFKTVIVDNTGKINSTSINSLNDGNGIFTSSGSITSDRSLDFENNNFFLRNLNTLSFNGVGLAKNMTFEAGTFNFNLYTFPASAGNNGLQYGAGNEAFTVFFQDTTDYNRTFTVADNTFRYRVIDDTSEAIIELSDFDYKIKSLYLGRQLINTYDSGNNTYNIALTDTSSDLSTEIRIENESIVFTVNHSVDGVKSQIQMLDDQITIIPPSYTVATLPAGSLGSIAVVTDAIAPSYLSTVVGGGSVICPVFHNGTNWVCR